VLGPTGTCNSPGDEVVLDQPLAPVLTEGRGRTAMSTFSLTVTKVEAWWLCKPSTGHQSHRWQLARWPPHFERTA